MKSKIMHVDIALVADLAVSHESSATSLFLSNEAGAVPMLCYEKWAGPSIFP